MTQFLTDDEIVALAKRAHELTIKAVPESKFVQNAADSPLCGQIYATLYAQALLTKNDPTLERAD